MNSRKREFSPTPGVWSSVAVALVAAVATVQGSAVMAAEQKAAMSAEQKAGIAVQQKSVVFEKKILGKDYRIESIEGGKYLVSWGEEKLTWEPKPFHDHELRQRGPALYTDWLRPLYYPYTITLEEREKLNAFEVLDSAFPWWPGVPGFTAEDLFDAHLYAPGAEYRRDKTGFEWNAYYSRAKSNPLLLWDPSPPPDLDGQVYRKYVFLFRSPRDLVKVGFLQVQYQGKTKEDDNYLYVPTVRKVRRLATANRQDVFGGLILRQEQNALLTPIHNYKMIGTALMNYPKEDPLVGYGSGEVEQQSADPSWERVDGIGEPCWVIETTPFREDWWFAKQITYVGMFTMHPLFQDTFDVTGRRIQRMAPEYSLNEPGPASKDQVPNCCGAKRHLYWNSLALKDYTTGFWVLFYAKDITINPPIPDSFYNTQTLIEEPTTIDFYRR